MVTECFNVRTRKNVSKLLKQYADGVLMQMVLVIFSNLNSQHRPAQSASTSVITSPPAKRRPQSTDLKLMSPTSAAMSGRPASEDGADTEPYGLPAMVRVFRFLVSLINPFDKRYEESTRYALPEPSTAVCLILICLHFASQRARASADSHRVRDDRHSFGPLSTARCRYPG